MSACIDMSKRSKDITGLRVGSRVAVRQVGRSEAGNAIWLVRCDCGREDEVRSHSFRQTMLCPTCSAKAHTPKHGMSQTYEYGCWSAMNDRVRRLERYRQLGIHPQWRDDFTQFYADLGPAPSNKHTLDRKQNHIGYYPGNVRWATMLEQGNNRSNNHRLVYNGRTQTLSEWSRETGIGKSTLRERLRRGWTVADALTKVVA